MNSNAFITNISFPKTLEEVLYFMHVRGHFDVEEVLEKNYVEWTSPKWAEVGNTVFFMHSKTSIDTIRSLKRQSKSDVEFSDQQECDELKRCLEHGEELHSKIGGCVFAVGTVNGSVIEDRISQIDRLHWKSIYYAPIDNIKALDRPVNIVEFRNFIKVSRTGAITPLDDEQCRRLLELAGL